MSDSLLPKSKELIIFLSWRIEDSREYELSFNKFEELLLYIEESQNFLNSFSSKGNDSEADFKQIVKKYTGHTNVTD